MGIASRAAVLALTLSLFAASGAVAQGGLKLAHIDSRVILAQAPNRAQIDSQIQRRLTPLQTRMKAMDDSLRAMVAAFQKDDATLTPAVRQQRTETIQKSEQRWETEAQRLRERAAFLQDSLTRPLIETFNQALSDIRNEDGYAYIFDVGSQAQAILAVDKNLDISDKVIARMRTAMAAKAATPPKPLVGPAAPPGTTVTRPPPGR